MQQAFIIEDIDKGAYDTKFEKLILLARSIYRIEQLNNMANIYMKRYPHKDEIEVYLSFQTKLHQELDLQHLAPDMNSFICTSISKADLILAEINTGKIVFEKIQLEINLALMKDFFSERQVIDLIDKKVWLTN